MNTYKAHGKTIEVRDSGIAGYMATLDSYDGAPDADDENGFMGWDRTEIGAVNDLLAVMDLPDIETLESAA